MGTPYQKKVKGFKVFASKLGLRVGKPKIEVHIQNLSALECVKANEMSKNFYKLQHKFSESYKFNLNRI